MIIGDGDIASVLPESELLFFASGVSNSREENMDEYLREFNLLTEQPKDKHLVYFSSLAVFSSDSIYINHKRVMEINVKTLFPRYTIIRIGNIDWGSNPHTLINYLRAHPDAELRDEYRYITDKEEFLHWINLIPEWACEMNIPGRRLKVEEIYVQYVKGQ